MEKKHSFNFHPNLNFPYETSKNNVSYLDLNVSLRYGVIPTDLYIKPTDGHQYLHYQSSYPITLKCQYHTVKR